jgi:hypothetical protein
MSKFRFSKRIDITIEPTLLQEVDIYAGLYHTSRSAIIRWALHDWLEQYGVKSEQPEVAINKPINKQQSFHDLIKPGMSPDELLALLKEYEAA